MSQSLVRHFMSSPVATVRPDLPLHTAAARMCDEKISCLVVTEDETTIGIVTERDITRAVAENKISTQSAVVSDIMTSGVLSLNIDAACTEALSLLKQNSIRRCVIVDARQTMRGVITQTDLLRAHTRDIELQKQVLEDRVHERTRELKQLNQRLETLSRVDSMLEIGNRRAMDIALEQLQSRTNRSGRGYALALIDVDYFKAYNDHYGHLAGDVALKNLADAIKQNIRVADSLYRYGGEEFLIIFPDESLEDAAISAERVRQGIQACAFEHEASALGVVTVSIGVAALSETQEHWESVLRNADNALYKAKNQGKNRIETFSAKRIAQDSEISEKVAG